MLIIQIILANQNFYLNIIDFYLNTFIIIKILFFNNIIMNQENIENYLIKGRNIDDFINIEDNNTNLSEIQTWITRWVDRVLTQRKVPVFSEKPVIREISIDLYSEYIIIKDLCNDEILFLNLETQEEERYFVKEVISKGDWEITFLWHRVMRKEYEKWTRVKR